MKNWRPIHAAASIFVLLLRICVSSKVTILQKSTKANQYFSSFMKVYFTFDRSHIFFLQRIARLLCFNARHWKNLSYMQHDRIEATRSIDLEHILFVSLFLAKVSSPMLMYMKTNLRTLLCHHRHFAEN